MVICGLSLKKVRDRTWFELESLLPTELEAFQDRGKGDCLLRMDSDDDKLIVRCRLF